MKIEDANQSLKQGLYKLYLFKTLQEGIELKDIKENLNRYLQEESIGAGYRNLVRDYVKDGLVEIIDKKYQLTQQGEIAFESLSKNLIAHAGNFNNVPTPDLNIDEKIINRFNFKDYPLEIRRFYSNNEKLNLELEKSFCRYNNLYKKDLLASLIFSNGKSNGKSNEKKIQYLNEKYQFDYIQYISSLISPDVIRYFKNSTSLKNYKIFLSSIWTLRLIALSFFIQAFGLSTTIQGLKTITISFFLVRLIQKGLSHYPLPHKTLSFFSALCSLLVILGVYFYNTRVGLTYHHIQLLDISLSILISLEAVSFYFKNARLKGMSFMQKLFAKYAKYKIPAYTFLIGFLGLFYQMTYPVFTIQFSNIVALFYFIPFFIGADLFEHYESIQAATLDIKNS